MPTSISTRPFDSSYDGFRKVKLQKGNYTRNAAHTGLSSPRSRDNPCQRSEVRFLYLNLYGAFYYYFFLMNLILIHFHSLGGVWIQRAHTDFIKRTCKVQLHLPLKAPTALRSTGARFWQIM